MTIHLQHNVMLHTVAGGSFVMLGGVTRYLLAWSGVERTALESKLWLFLLIMPHLQHCYTYNYAELKMSLPCISHDALLKQYSANYS